MEERRAFKRARFDKLVRCNIVENGEMTDAIAQSVNISAGGISIRPEYVVEPEQPLALEIVVPGYYKAIYARGHIRWSRGDDMEDRSVAGIEFTRIASQDQQRILDYVHF